MPAILQWIVSQQGRLNILFFSNKKRGVTLLSVLRLSWTDASNDPSSGRKVSFFSATAKQSGGKYKETTFTISPCVHFDQLHSVQLWQ